MRRRGGVVRCVWLACVVAVSAWDEAGDLGESPPDVLGDMSAQGTAYGLSWPTLPDTTLNPFESPFVLTCAVSGATHGPEEVKSQRALDLVATTLGTPFEPFVVVLVYAAGCAFSRLLLPVYEELACSFKDVHFLQIEGRREWPFTTRHLVRSVPSLLIFSQGKIRARHDGERSLAQLQVFVHNVTGADTIELGGDSCLLRWSAGHSRSPRATPRVDYALVFSMIVLTVLLLFRLYACCRKPATAEKLPVGTI